MICIIGDVSFWEIYVLNYALGSINRVHLTCSLVYTSICHSLRLMAVLMLILTVISLCILLLYLVHTFVQGVSCSCLK